MPKDEYLSEEQIATLLKIAADIEAGTLNPEQAADQIRTIVLENHRGDVN